MTDDIVLETKDLTKHYGGVHALEGANFTLRKGEHVAIMEFCRPLGCQRSGH